MKPKLIKTEQEHLAALATVEILMEAEPGSPEEDELELWSLLVEQYEKENWPIEHPDPIEAIRFRMDQLGLQQKDLVPMVGTKSKVSEILNRKRPLSLPMIRSLHRNLGIPAATLVREAPAAETIKLGSEAQTRTALPVMKLAKTSGIKAPSLTEVCELVKAAELRSGVD